MDSNNDMLSFAIIDLYLLLKKKVKEKSGISN